MFNIDIVLAMSGHITDELLVELGNRGFVGNSWTLATSWEYLFTSPKERVIYNAIREDTRLFIPIEINGERRLDRLRRAKSYLAELYEDYSRKYDRMNCINNYEIEGE